MPKTSANNDEIEKEEPKINDLDIKKLGKWIKKNRTGKKFDYQQMAAACGVGSHIIQQYENGTVHTVDISIVKKFEGIFGSFKSKREKNKKRENKKRDKARMLAESNKCFKGKAYNAFNQFYIFL